MTKEKEAKERIRKAYAPNGQRSQVMMAFRIDLENLEWLNSHTTNKGRFLNDLIRAASGGSASGGG